MQIEVARALKPAQLLLIAPLAIRIILGQTGPASPPIFEVASIKEHIETGHEGSGTPGLSISGNRVRISGLSVLGLLTYAYKLKEYQIIHKNSEITSVLNWVCDIDARANEEKTATPDHVRLMVQNLLSARLTMRFHHEKRRFSVYAIVVDSRRGLRMSKAEEDPNAIDRIKRDSFGFPELPAGRKNIAVATMPNGRVRIMGRVQPIATLANSLERELGRPVVDKTLLTETYDFTLDFMRERAVSPEDAGRSQPTETTLPLFFAIQEQLGLVNMERPTDSRGVTLRRGESSGAEPYTKGIGRYV